MIITTKDNPYSPNVDFENWYAYDIANGYNTLGVVADLINTTVEYSSEVQKEDFTEACLILLSLLPELYRLVEDASD